MFARSIGTVIWIFGYILPLFYKMSENNVKQVLISLISTLFDRVGAYVVFSRLRVWTYRWTLGELIYVGQVREHLKDAGITFSSFFS